jgi:hypothetical protein
VPAEDGLRYSINYMKLIKEFYNLYLGKTDHTTSYWLDGRSMSTEDRLSLFFSIVFSCFLYNMHIMNFWN